MMHCGLLGGLLMLSIHVAASQNLPDDGGNSPNVTEILDTPKTLSEEIPRWLVGTENKHKNRERTSHEDLGSSSQHSHYSSAHSASDRRKSSEERPSRTSEESDEDRSVTTKKPKTTRRTTTSKPSRESEDSHSDRSHKSSRPHRERSSEPFHWNSWHRSSSSASSEEGSEMKKRRTTVTPKTTARRSHERASSSSSEERSGSRKWMIKPPRWMKKSGKKPHSGDSFPSEERSGSRKWMIKRPRWMKKSGKKPKAGSGSSSSSDTSKESSRRTCVRQKRSKWHKLMHLIDNMSIEDSRKPMKRCRDHHKKRCACHRYPYRSLNGTCNNLEHPDSGAAETPLRRVVAARYCDGKSTVRRSAVDGLPLPSSRVITSRVFAIKNIEHETITHLTAIFWIFVAEDIFLRKPREDSHRCCTSSGKMIPEEDLPDSCLPIEIPENDPFFSVYHQRCMSYGRSEIADKCKKERHRLRLGHRRIRPIEQLNTKTSYLDLSPVYGTCKEESDKLREHKNGLLKTRLVHHEHPKTQRSYLPNVDDPRKVCKSKREDDICYLSANSQVNKVIALAALQTLFVRYHNNVAKRLHNLHPNWNDEDLFQQTRKIMIAIYQNIVYNEWISTLLAKETLKRLKLCHDNFRHKHHKNHVDASAISDMASAGLLMSNTLLSSLISLMDEKRHTQKKIHLIRTAHEPNILEKNNNFDSIIRGLTAQPAEEFDGNFDKEFLNLEVKNKDGKASGVDLVAFDVQSGRDYGISTYNDARELCHLKRAKKFEDFEDTINKKSIDKLEFVYSCPNDVDLLVGLFLEKHYDGGVLGRVGSCLFGEQFARLRDGDRFFATDDKHERSFTKDQFSAILAVKFSALVCRSSDQVERMQLKAFHQISSENELKHCSEIPKLDLTPWENMVLPINKC